MNTKQNDKTTTVAACPPLSEGLERMAVSEDETNALMKDGRLIQCAFGREVWLLPVEENRWAFEMIAKLRSNLK